MASFDWLEICSSSFSLQLWQRANSMTHSFLANDFWIMYICVELMSSVPQSQQVLNS